MIQQATRSTPRADLGVAYHEFSPDGLRFVAEEAMPTLPVAQKAATLSVITRENAQSVDNAHANGAGFSRITMGSEDKSYSTTDKGLEIAVTDEDRAAFADDYDAEVEAIQVLKLHMLLRREIRAAAALFNTTTWTGADLYTDYNAAPWDAAGTDVIGQTQASAEIVRRNTGIKPKSLLIGPVTFNNLKLNTAILAKFTNPGVLTASVWRQYIADILDLKEIIVADGVYNAAKEGQDADMTDIWSDDYALLFHKHTGPIAMPGLARTVNWTGIAQSLVGLNAMNEIVVSYREEQTESDVFRVREYTSEFVIDPYFGHLMKIDA